MKTMMEGREKGWKGKFVVGNWLKHMLMGVLRWKSVENLLMGEVED
jgi:hypothetical protein